MNDIHTIEHFFGVYLLYCTNPKYFGRTYIGYTVNPNRRIKQHNKGKKAGGAWKTSNRGPWSMVMVVHGFPNDIAALRFEWAWQHPHASRRLQHVTKKKSREKSFDFCLRVLSEMLLVAPWKRLPLTVRWLNQEYARDFPVNKTPPMHMPICYGHGPVISKKLQKNQSSTSLECKSFILDICFICDEEIPSGRKLTCLNLECDLKAHIICLANSFKNKSDYVPIEGKCLKCNCDFLWGDIIRKFKGCYNNADMQINLNNCDNFYSSDSE